MKSICFFNNKGGVGKTTLLCNLSSYIAKYHAKKILVIDADPQCNASAYLLKEEALLWTYESTLYRSLDSIYDSIRRGKGFSQEIPSIIRSERFGVDLITGDPRLSSREDFLATEWESTIQGQPRGFQTTFAIQHLLSKLTAYDIVMIDMGPSLGALNRSIILSADAFIMPVSIDIFSLMAITNILLSFKAWQKKLDNAIKQHRENEGGEDFKINEIPVNWSLDFIGYVIQQYRSKEKNGEKLTVGAFEVILRRQENAFKELCNFFGYEKREDANLGEIPVLNSLIPLSQQAHAPVFDLGNSDGIVGSHYNRVAEARDHFKRISEKFLARVSK